MFNPQADWLISQCTPPEGCVSSLSRASWLVVQRQLTALGGVGAGGAAGVGAVGGGGVRVRLQNNQSVSR